MTIQEIKNNIGNRLWRLNNLYWIKDAKGETIRFKLNKVQKWLLDNLWYLNIVLKARQLGMTTYFCILFLDDTLFSGVDSCFIAHTADDTQNIFHKKIKFAWDRMPKAIKALYEVDTNNARELRFKSRVTRKVSSIIVKRSGRGDTYQRVHICLSGDTTILLKDGNTKNIKDIIPGDIVINERGSYAIVNDLVKNRFEDIKEKMFEVDVFGDYNPLKLTGNHKVLTRGIRGKNIKKDFIWKETKQLKVGDYIGFPIRKTGNKSNNILFGETKIEQSYDLGFIAGLYCAEGTIQRKEVCFSLHRDEIKFIEQQINKIDCLRGKTRKYYSKTSKTAQIYVKDSNLILFLEKYFGKGKDKFISDTIFGRMAMFQKGVLFGYLYGDGCFKNSREISAISIRRQLIEQIKNLFILLRYGYPTIYNKKEGFWYNRNCKETWTIKLSGAGNWKFRKEFGLELPKYNTWRSNYRIENGKNPDGKKFWRKGGNVYWAQIKNIKEIEGEEFVYDIVLDREPHSFTTTSGIVHNSELSTIDQEDGAKSDEIKTGTINTVHKGQVIVVESTPKLPSGLFFDITKLAEENKKREKRGIMDWQLHFFPWYFHDDYRLEGDYYDIPKELVDYFEELKERHGIILENEQKFWYYKKSLTQKEQMKNEFPSTIDECFMAAVEGTYYARELDKLIADGRLTNVPYNTRYPVDTYWDLGTTTSRKDAMSVVFVQQIGQAINVIDFYGCSGEGFPHMKKILDDREYVYGKHFAPHDIEVKEVGTGKTRMELAADLGIRFYTVPKNGFNDGIESVRSILSRVWIDERRCGGEKGLFYALRNYRKEYDPNNKIFKDKPVKDWTSDPCDAFRMMAVGINENVISNEIIKNKEEIKKVDTLNIFKM